MKNKSEKPLFVFGTGGVEYVFTHTQEEYEILHGSEKSNTSASPDHNCITINNHL